MTEPLYPETTIDLLRHGHCEGGKVLRGVTDSPLSPAGWRQMQLALEPHHGWERVISSPLIRCRAFGNYFARLQKLPHILMSELREIDFGDWDGLSAEEIEAKDPLSAKAFYQHPETVVPPAGEPLVSARQRFIRAWQKILAAYEGEHLLVVGHGGGIRILLAFILGTPSNQLLPIAVPYGCLTRIKIWHTPDGPFPQLIFHQPEAQ